MLASESASLTQITEAWFLRFNPRDSTRVLASSDNVTSAKSTLNTIPQDKQKGV